MFPRSFKFPKVRVARQRETQVPNRPASFPDPCYAGIRIGAEESLGTFDGAKEDDL